MSRLSKVFLVSFQLVIWILDPSKDFFQILLPSSLAAALVFITSIFKDLNQFVMASGQQFFIDLFAAARASLVWMVIVIAFAFEDLAFGKSLVIFLAFFIAQVAVVFSLAVVWDYLA